MWGSIPTCSTPWVKLSSRIATWQHQWCQPARKPSGERTVVTRPFVATEFPYILPSFTGCLWVVQMLSVWRWLAGENRLLKSKVRFATPKSQICHTQNPENPIIWALLLRGIPPETAHHRWQHRAAWWPTDAPPAPRSWQHHRHSWRDGRTLGREFAENLGP